jgi:hypothetical protein
MLAVGNDDVERSRGLSPMRPSEMIMTGRPPPDVNFELAKLRISPYKNNSTEDLIDQPTRRRPLLSQDSMHEFPYTQADWSSSKTSSSSEIDDQKSRGAESDTERLGLDIPLRGRLATLRAHGQPSKPPRSPTHRRDYSFTPGDEQDFSFADGERIRKDDSGQSASEVAGLVAITRAEHEMKENVTEKRSPSKEKVENGARAGRPCQSLTSQPEDFPELKGPQPKRYSHPRVADLDELASSFDDPKTPERDNSTNSVVTVKRVSEGIHGSLPRNRGHSSIRDTDPNALAAAKAAVSSSTDSVTGILSPGSNGNEEDSPSAAEKSRKQLG